MKVSISNAGHYCWGDRCDGWHLADCGDLSVIHERMPPHTAEVRHFHSRSRQFFFVLKGQAEMEADGETSLLNLHEGVEIPPGVPHQMMNNSEDEIEFLVVSAPRSKGDRTPAPGINPGGINQG
jgi:mannose-6-phosphate isomerase-like protein (cupin superfamily)